MNSFKTIGITGAAGFIGSHLSERLLEQGVSVVGLDNLCDFYDPQVKRDNIKKAQKNSNYTFIQGDIREFDSVKKAFEACDAVVHLAAMVGVRPSLEQPRLYTQVNVDGTQNVFEACHQNKIKSVLFASSSSVYGNNQKTPFAETDPVDHPISVYAATKKAGELLAHTYHALYDMDITCLRFFMGAGK